MLIATQWGSNYRGGSTLLGGYVRNAAEVDYFRPIPVECIGFSRWLGGGRG